MHAQLDNCPTASLQDLSIRTQEAAGGDVLPADFDWQAYIYWNPDLVRNGLATEAAAQEHYQRRGHMESRMYKRYCTVMLYDPVGGVLLHALCTDLIARSHQRESCTWIRITLAS